MGSRGRSWAHGRMLPPGGDTADARTRDAGTAGRGVAGLRSTPAAGLRGEGCPRPYYHRVRGPPRVPTTANPSLSVRSRGESSGAVGRWWGFPAQVGAVPARTPSRPPQSDPEPEVGLAPEAAGQGGAGRREGYGGRASRTPGFVLGLNLSLCLSFPGRTGGRAAPL